MNKKIKILTTAVLLIASLTISIQTEKQSASSESSISPIHACYAVDINNPAEVVGEADYTFVAKVTAITGTIYKNKMWTKGADGTIAYTGDAYTQYEVQVISNLKNELQTDITIPLSKEGGIREDGSGYDIFEDDFLPEVGKTYIFIANTQEDGSLLISGANSNIAFPEDEAALTEESKIKETELYQEYAQAVKNEVLFEDDVLSKKYGK